MKTAAPQTFVEGGQDCGDPRAIADCDSRKAGADSGCFRWARCAGAPGLDGKLLATCSDDAQLFADQMVSYLIHTTAYCAPPDVVGPGRAPSMSS